MHDPIAGDVRDFIYRHIDSVAHLEALLLLRSKPNEGWGPAEMAKRLYATEPEITEVLTSLCEDGLLSHKSGFYRYENAPDVQKKIDKLADVYSKHLIAVTNLIHAKPRRIREFADAFRFRKGR